MTDSIARLRAAGVSVWLDDLSRERLTTGSLAALGDRGVSGVTTNPTIFARAISDSDAYVKDPAYDDTRYVTGLVAVLDDLAALGIDYADVVQALEDQGVTTFDASWDHLGQ
ncbi:MAG TPA: transaldolase family protein, partial [Streptosporangiaceae bacterium]|nr:transaldolase family protein [Streptosporangiaceae bacterium]